MLRDSRERDQFKSASKRDQESLTNMDASEIRFQAAISTECSAQVAVKLIHGKWKTRILSRLQHGPARLSELRRLFPQASKKMLVQHLREMERDGLVVRKNLSERVLHVEYCLSESGGYAALHLISMLQNWSHEHLPFRTKERIGIAVEAGYSGADRSRPHSPQSGLGVLP